MPPYSLLGKMNTKPYALGERPGGQQIPTIPLLSGKEAWDSLSGYYDSKHGDSKLLEFTADGATRATDRPEEKKAFSPKSTAVGAVLGSMSPLAALGAVGGAGIGAGYGALFPGRDEKGSRKSRWLAALRSGLIGGGVGGLAGVGAGAVGGGMAGNAFGERMTENRGSPQDQELLRAMQQLQEMQKGASAQFLLEKNSGGKGVWGAIGSGFKRVSGTLSKAKDKAKGVFTRKVPGVPKTTGSGMGGGGGAKPLPVAPAPAPVRPGHIGAGPPSKPIPVPALGAVQGGNWRGPPPVSTLKALRDKGKALLGATAKPLVQGTKAVGGMAKRHPWQATALAGAGAAGAYSALPGPSEPAKVPYVPKPEDVSATLEQAGNVLQKFFDPVIAGLKQIHENAKNQPPTPIGDVGGFLQKWGPHIAIGGGGLLGLYMLAKSMRGKSKEERDRERWAELPKMAAANPQQFAVEHPIVTGFLVRCAEASLDDAQIRVKIAHACEIDPMIRRAFEKVAVPIPDIPDVTATEGGGVPLPNPTQPPLPGALQLDESMDYWDGMPKLPTGEHAWRTDSVSGIRPQAAVTELLPDVYEGNVIERSSSGQPTVLGTWDTDAQGNRTTPRPNPQMTKSRQDFKQQWEAWKRNRRLQEQKWLGMGDEGKREAWRRLREYQNREAVNQPASHRTLSQPGGGDWNNLAAPVEGTYEQTIKRLGYKSTQEYADAKGRAASRAKTPYKAQWAHAFGDAPEEHVRAAAAGNLWSPDGKVLKGLMASDPQFAKVFTDYSQRMDTELNSVPEDEALQRWWAGATNLAREHYAPRAAVYDFAAKMYNEFGGEHTIQPGLGSMPGGQAYADVFEQGKMRHWEDEPRYNYRAYGPVSAETRQPFERVRGIESTHRAVNENEHQRMLDKLDTNPWAWAAHATNRHADPKYMRQEYKLRGHDPADAAQRASADLYKMRHGAGKGHGGLGSQLAHNFSDPMYLPGLTYNAGMGAMETGGHLLAKTPILAESLLSRNPDAVKQFGKGIAQIIERPLTQGSNINLLGMDLKKNETGEAGFMPGRETTWDHLRGRWGPHQAAGTNPGSYNADVENRTNALAEMKATLKRQPSYVNYLMNSDDPRARTELAAMTELERWENSGRAANEQALAKSVQQSNPASRIGHRILGTAANVAPDVAEFSALGGLAAPRGLGWVTGGSRGLSKFTAMDPVFGAGQGVLDETGIGKWQRLGANKLRDATSRNPEANPATRIGGSALAGMLEDPLRAAYFMRGLPGKQKALIPGLYGLGQASSEAVEPSIWAANLGSEDFDLTTGAQPPDHDWKNENAYAFGMERAPVPPPQPVDQEPPPRDPGESFREWEGHTNTLAETTPLTVPAPEPNNVHITPESTPTSTSEATRQGPAPSPTDSLSATVAAVPGAIDPAKVEALLPGQQDDVSGALGQAKNRIGNTPPEVIQRVQTALAEGDHTPASQEAVDKLSKQMGSTPEGVQEMYAGMDTGARMLLWLGLGIGAIGLISSIVSDDGGMLPLVLGLAGLTAAGGAAAHAGMLGTTAQGVARGVMGGQGEPENLTDVITGAGADMPWLQDIVADNKVTSKEFKTVMDSPEQRQQLLQLPTASIDKLVQSAGNRNMGTRIQMSVLGGMDQDAAAAAIAKIMPGLSPEETQAVYAAAQRYSSAP